MILMDTLVHWWPSLLVCHRRCAGDVGIEEDFPWHAQQMCLGFSNRSKMRCHCGLDL